MIDVTRAETPPGLSMAVVGLGYWGPNLIRNLRELSEVTSVGVRSPGRPVESIAPAFCDAGDLPV